MTMDVGHSLTQSLCLIPHRNFQEAMHSDGQTDFGAPGRAVFATLVLLTLVFDFVVVGSAVSDQEAGAETYKERNQYRYNLRIGENFFTIENDERLDDFVDKK